MNNSVKTAPLFNIAHAAQPYRCYPGEKISLLTRLQAAEPISDEVTLLINIPADVELLTQTGPPGHGPARLDPTPRQMHRPNQQEQPLTYRTVSWQIKGQQLVPGRFYEYQVMLKAPLVSDQDVTLKTWAEVSYGEQPHTGATVLSAQVAAIQVQARANAIKYLPAIYQDPEHALMWRYLMVFDRVWQTYNELLAGLPFYFDPHLAPPDFKAWLAGWVGWQWNEHIPAPVQQNLILHAARLQQQQGTRRGLQTYLQLCLDHPATAGQYPATAGRYPATAGRYVNIEEKLIGNFMMGSSDELGDGLCLGGTEDEMGHFIVTLSWPHSAQEPDETLIRSIIEAWKPAHTSYELRLVGETQQQ